MEFAERLLSINPGYGRANPQVAERLKTLKPQNRHYLAHEYFNRDWHPMSFAKIAEWLEPAKVVLRGETVEVEAVHGGARLKLEGIAEGSGAIGETIPIQNPVSKQRFQARVESKRRVVVTKGSL